MILGAGMLWDAAATWIKQQERAKAPAHYCNVYERTDGLQVVGYGWRDRAAADQAAEHGGRRVFVLRIRERSR